MANAILTLLADHERRLAYGQAGRHRVETVFPMERMLSETETLYLGN